jgi:hypothetical protein
LASQALTSDHMVATPRSGLDTMFLERVFLEIVFLEIVFLEIFLETMSPGPHVLGTMCPSIHTG